MRLWISRAEKRDRVLAALRGGARYAIDIAAASGMGLGRVYPTLSELEHEEIVVGEWAELMPSGYRRRVYRLVRP